MVSEMRLLGHINRIDLGSSENVIRQVLREEVSQALEEIEKKKGDGALQASGADKWSKVVGRRKRGPRVVIDDQGANENVREELLKCLYLKAGQVSVRNIRRQAKNFLVEIHSDKDLGVVLTKDL